MDLLIAPYTVSKGQADTAPATGTPGWATDGNPATNTPATQWPAYAFNALQEEMSTVITGGAGLTLDRDDNTQLLKAINKLVTAAVAGRPLAYSISALPGEDIGPIVVVECGEVWIWTESSYFSGYRSPLCGRPQDGHTITPLASEIDAVGGLLPKLAYARLWGYAQENGLAVTQAIWTANVGAHYFVDVDSNQFRVPDLRNMFRRFTGTDADTANARALGSKQAGSVHSFDTGPGVGFVSDRTAASSITGSDGRISLGYDAVSAGEYPLAQVVSSSGGTAVPIVNTPEVAFGTTRPPNAGYHPRIHA